ncbi:MAG TPA: DUF4870 domain-containing protein [Verrucomicrobiales bacterium]|nr:DUF4870 domain-containing protein [Verrucomicrobiales bacterium]
METTPPVIDSNDKLWVVLCHLSTFLGVALLLPLVVYLVKKDDSEFVRWHAKEALNFHLSLLIYAIVSFLLVLVVIGVFLLIALGITAIVLAIIAAIKASNGERYAYPLTIRFVR